MERLTPKFKKQIVSHGNTLSERLRNGRETLGWSLEELSERTGIQKKYLSALEHEKPHVLPEDIYVRKFLTRMAEVMRMRPKLLLEPWERSFGRARCTVVRRTFGKRTTFVMNHILKGVGIFAVAILVVGYLGRGVIEMRRAPSLTILAPQEGATTNNTEIRIEGLAGAGAQVLINNSPAGRQTNGVFSELMNLQPGLNVIKITASKRNGREVSVYRNVIRLY